MEENFLKNNMGINNWWNYIISFFLLLTILILSDHLATKVYKWYVERDGSAASFYSPDLNQAFSMNPYINYSFLQLYNVLCLIGIALVMLLIHRRSVLTLITPNKKVNWRKIGWGFLILLLPMCVTTFFDYLLFPSDYELNRLNTEVFLKVLGLLIIFLPIQTLMEEFFLRSYLMQLIGTKVSNKIVLSIIVGLINGGLLIYVDPYLMDLEPVYTGLSYIVIGILLSYITAKTNSLEIAIGAKFVYYLYISVLSMLGFTRYQFFPNYYSLSSLYTKMYLVWIIFSYGILTFVTLKLFQDKKQSLY
ncbi:type II CAAX prenyl endopeptidase Rce1 family protein [Bacillus sp. AFS037270]|uniref:CPBP family glutamic-type intramembrane protease n=1 Tax=Bacillus sp. AFS037270 TaxID=2033499 RepID=UPI000BFC038B|nr:CPBP family intramembrane glutamic endopeptidase [Bacillus sp. AFS037270]PGV53451.1 hypothetical protein COD92_07650 [Bacillus sp. AFS037270]